MPVTYEHTTSPPAPVFHDVRLPNGVRLRYAEQGPRDGTAVVMLHGYTDSSFSFSRILPLLPTSLRIVVPDQRGHGGSDHPSGYAMEDFATDVRGLMDALAIPQATIVGHSMGSFVARRVAALAPSRVVRLVLVGAGLHSRNEAVSALAQSVGTLEDPVDHEFVRDFQNSTVRRDVPPWFMSYAIAESERVPARVWKEALAGLMACEPVEPQISAPTTILGGDADGVFSVDEQEALARAIPGSRLCLFSGIGHALHWEDPGAFADALLEVIPR